MSYKPIPLDRAAYPLAGGVDTKVHGVVLPPPKLQTCENAYADQSGSLRRRNGRTSLPSVDVQGNTIIGTFQALALHQERLLAVSYDQHLYDFGEADQRFANRGTFYSWPISTTPVDALSQVQALPATKDMGILGQYTLYAYDYTVPNNANLDYYTAFTLVDAEGTRYASNQTLSSKINSGATLSSSVKVVTSGTKFYVIYSDVNAVANLRCFIIDTTSAATITASLAGASTLLAATFGGALDAYSLAFGTPIVTWIHSTPGTIGLMAVSTAGAPVGATTFLSVGNPLSISISVLTSIGIAYATGVAGADVYARIYTFNGTAFTLVQTSGALEPAVVNSCAFAQCVWTDTLTLRVFYIDKFAVYNGTREATFTTAGVAVTGQPFIARATPVSRPFMTGSGDPGPFVWVCNEDALSSNAQPTIYLFRWDGLFMGYASKGIAAVTLLGLAFGLPHVPVSGTIYHLITDQYSRISGGETALGFQAGPGTSSAMRDVAVDVGNQHSGNFTQDGQCTYFPGGMFQQYDAVGATELNFVSFVDTQKRVALAQSPVATPPTLLTLLKTYAYRFVPMWINGQGERELGTDGGSKTITLTGANNVVTATLDAVPWTRKNTLVGGRQDFVIGVFRCVDPTGNDQFNLVGTVTNRAKFDVLTFVDKMSDAVAATQEFAYFGSSQLGDELDNIAPPACSLSTAGNGRVFLAGLADDPNLILYSKTRGHGEALAFSDNLNIVIPQADGPITAIVVFAEYLIAFCERGIYRVNGGGLNNTGSSGGFTEPVRVMTDGGTSSWRNVVVTPMGVMFRGTKGIMLLTPSFTVEYIGAPVEKLLLPAVSVVSSVLVPERQQVRFTLVEGTLVFDYYHSQWYRFTHQGSAPGLVWNDQHTIIAQGIDHDDEQAWNDGGVNYQVTITLGWMHGSALPSDISIRRLGLVGQSLDAHYLGIMIAKDQSATPNQTIAETIAGVGPIQEQWRVKEQVVSQMEVTIVDWNSSIYGFPVSLNTAGFCLNELSFELGLRTHEFGRKG